MDSGGLLILRWASQLLVRVAVRRAHQVRRTAALVSSQRRGCVRTLGGIVHERRHPLPLPPPARLRVVNPGVMSTEGALYRNGGPAGPARLDGRCRV